MGNDFGDAASSRLILLALGTLLHEEVTPLPRRIGMDPLFRHLRFSWRMLAKSRGFTVAVILSLALGIGSNTAIFSVINAVLLRPLLYPNPDQLVRFWGVHTQKSTEKAPVSLPDFNDWSESAKSFEGMAAVNGWPPILTGLEEPQELVGLTVSQDFFPLLGARPQLGRLLGPQDNGPTAPPAVVITDGLWKQLFHGDLSVIGQSMMLNSTAYEVIGVLPADFEDPKLNLAGPPQIYRPIRFPFSDMPRSGHFWQAIGRLAPGVSLEQAQKELSTISRRLENEYPNDNAGWGVLLVPLRNEIVGGTRKVLLVLLGAVGVVLLIACANVANSLLVRFLARSREIAVRTALGARKGSILSQLLIESITLSLIGGILGVLLAHWGTRILVALASAEIPRIEYVRTDARVVLFGVGLSLLTGLIFGLLPALEAARPNLQQVLKEGGRTQGLARQRLRAGIVIFAVALSLILLVQAGILIKSFYNVKNVDPGFDPRHLLTLRLPIPSSTFDSRDEVLRFYDNLFMSLGQLRGVQSVGAVHLLPLAGGLSCDDFTIEGRPVPPENRPCAESRAIASGYFQTMRIPILRGRRLVRRDDMNHPRVAVINQAMASRFWPDSDPIGKRITVHEVAREIVGVVGSVHHLGLSKAPLPEIYTSQAQEPWDFMATRMYVVLRTAGQPELLIDDVHRVVAALNKDIPVVDVRTMEELVEGSAAEQRFRSLLVGAFALTALLLSAIGLYSMIGYDASQRTHEHGIRAAIGARPADIFSLVIFQGLKLALVGIIIGICGAIAAGRLIASLLYHVSAYDPVTFAGVVVVFVAISALAALVPALRAARVDPAITLRYE
jgi:putative ABC transport system permease protein